MSFHATFFRITNVTKFTFEWFRSFMNRYDMFNHIGFLKRLILNDLKGYLNIFPVSFRQDEKAILLSKMLTIDGKPYEELNQDGNKLLQDLLKVRDQMGVEIQI